MGTVNAILGPLSLAAALIFLGADASAFSPFELSSPGGAYSHGSGPTFTSFTINPFDVIVPSDGSFVTVPNVGTVTIPEAEDRMAPFVGTLEVAFGSLVFQDNVYAYSYAEPGYIVVVLSLDSLRIGIDYLVGLGIESGLSGQPGDHVSFPLEAAYAVVAPEPQEWTLIGAGLIVMAIFRLRNATLRPLSREN
jgi:hypothetical protein